jgi:hypothetical protein
MTIRGERDVIIITLTTTYLRLDLICISWAFCIGIGMGTEIQKHWVGVFDISWLCIKHLLHG